MKEKIFVYVNNAISDMMDDPNVRRFVNEKLSDDMWLNLGVVELPAEISPEILATEEFYHGYAAQQAAIIGQLGIKHIINPFMAGLITNFELWNAVIHGKSVEYFKAASYLDIPYDLYKTACNARSTDEDEIMSEEEYDEVSEAVKALVVNLGGEFYPESRIIH